MTERLYYGDPALLEFDATVVGQGQRGEMYFTLLDRSAFYPTSGGQLFDRGALNGIEIVETIEADDGEVRHLSNAPVGQTGDKVHGTVDRPRRQKNRQLHTAQHLISQVFIRLGDAETVSVHLGEEYGAVELNRVDITESELDQAERWTNELILDNLPVEIRVIDASDLLHSCT